MTIQKHKTYLFILFAIFMSTLLEAQIKETSSPAKTVQRNDEQGIEIPGNIIMKQDIDAIQEAYNGWWSESMKTHDARIGWYKDAKFGCFIHWGVSSPAGNEWNGTGGMGYSEHLMRSRKIPLTTYKKKLVATFNPVDFDAEEWIRSAKDAGMNYFIITAKHHDGFAMFPSDAYPYDIRMTLFKRNPMKELRDAATKYGIKFGFYYSHAFDWEHPDAPGNDWDYQNPGGDKLLHGANWWESYPQFLPNAEKYVNEKSIPQIKELIHNYHPDILWFDTPHKLPLYLNLKILKAIRETDPNVVVNGRLAGMQGQNFGDYANTADRAAFLRPTPGLWEVIPTTNESYGYNKFDHSHKSPKHFIRLISSAAAKGGNILLNVGPMGNGKWDAVDVEILNNIGTWMKINGESIYGTSRNPLSIQSWGEVTKKGNTLYLHVFQWPEDGKLVVGGLRAKVDKAFLITDPEKKALKCTSLNNHDLVINVPKSSPDTINSVIKLMFSGPLKTDSIRLLSGHQPNQLLVFDATAHGKGFKYGDGKPNSEFATNWKDKDQYLSWNFRLNEPAEFTLNLKYNTDKKDEKGQIFIEIDGKKYPVTYEPTLPDKDPSKRIFPPSVSLLIGNVKLKAGIHQIKLTPGEFQGAQLMRPLFLTLNPVDFNSGYDLYLLIGQSNMAGRGTIEPQDTITIPDVFMLNKGGNWVPAKSPLHFDKTAAGTGLGLTFGRIMADKSKRKIGLIPCAVGGTNISMWMPGAYDKITKTHPYDDAIQRMNITLQHGQLKGILWHQGEGDTSKERTSLYEQRFDSMLVYLQGDLSVDIRKIPVVVGELGRFYCLKNPKAVELNKVLRHISDTHKNIALVTSEGLTHKGDTLHFDAASQRELGKRYAEKMAQLEKGLLKQ
jgi:alpha-L-fucosidase